MKIRKNAEWLVTWNYDKNGNEKGDIRSQHRTYDAARKSAKRSGIESFLMIVAAAGYRQMGF